GLQDGGGGGVQGGWKRTERGRSRVAEVGRSADGVTDLGAVRRADPGLIAELPEHAHVPAPAGVVAIDVDVCLQSGRRTDEGRGGRGGNEPRRDGLADAL